MSHLAQAPDAGGGHLAPDQGETRRWSNQQFLQNAGVAVHDDVQAVEDRNEDHGLSQNARCDELEIGQPRHRYRPHLA